MKRTCVYWISILFTAKDMYIEKRKKEWDIVGDFMCVNLKKGKVNKTKQDKK